MPPRSTTSQPLVLFLASVLIGLEAFVAITYGVIEIAHVESARFVVGAGVTLLLLGYGALLIAVSRGVARGQRWSRGPAVATQLLQALLAYSFGQGATWWVGVVLGGVAIVALGCLLVPAATAVFAPDPPPEE